VYSGDRTTAGILTEVIEYKEGKFRYKGGESWSWNLKREPTLWYHGGGKDRKDLPAPGQEEHRTQELWESSSVGMTQRLRQVGTLPRGWCCESELRGPPGTGTYSKE
jgi:hypothetical protein